MPSSTYKNKVVHPFSSPPRRLELQCQPGTSAGHGNIFPLSDWTFAHIILSLSWFAAFAWILVHFLTFCSVIWKQKYCSVQGHSFPYFHHLCMWNSVATAFSLSRISALQQQRLPTWFQHAPTATTFNGKL